MGYEYGVCIGLDWIGKVKRVRVWEEVNMVCMGWSWSGEKQ
jgi:hypothetical protein